MKHFYVFILVFILFSTKSNVWSQTEKMPPAKSSDKVEMNLQKGTNQIAVQGLSFGWGYGRIIASTGFRYGYFIADKQMLFADFEYSTYGTDYNSYKIGLNYRMYFTNYNFKPFAQMGLHLGREYYFDSNTDFLEFSAAGGATCQVGKFGFELGVQLNITDNVLVSPLVGASFRF
jgi:hypothetical protein